MASKGQKFMHHTSELKEQILKEYLVDGMSSRCLGRKYGVSFKTIQNWVRKATKLNVNVMVDHRSGNSGRPKTKSLTLEDYKERYEILKKYRAFLQARREKK